MPPPEIAPCCNSTQTIRNDAAALDDLDRAAQQTEVRSNPTNERAVSTSPPVRESATATATKNPEAPKDSFVRNANPLREATALRGEGQVRTSETRTTQFEMARPFLSSSAPRSESASRSSRTSSDAQSSRDTTPSRSPSASTNIAQTNKVSGTPRQENLSAPQNFQKTNANNAAQTSFTQRVSAQTTSINTQGLAQRNASWGGFSTNGVQQGSPFQAFTSTLQGSTARIVYQSPMQQTLNTFAPRVFGFSSVPLGVLGFALPTGQGRGVETRSVIQGNQKSFSPTIGPIGGVQGNFSLSSFSALKRIESHMMQFARLLMGSYMFTKPGATGHQETYLEGALYLEDEIEERDEISEEEESLAEKVKQKRDAYFGGDAQHQKG